MDEQNHSADDPSQVAGKRTFAAAGEKLATLMKDPELQRIGYMILFAHRLIHWAKGLAGEVRDMNSLLVSILAWAQERASLQPFDFHDVLSDFLKNQLPWLEEQRTLMHARRKTAEKRRSRLKQRLRRSDLPLPFDSMRMPFGDDGFTHKDFLVLFGPAEAVGLVLRLSAIEYQRAGGCAMMLTRRGEEDERVARIFVRPFVWRNCCDVYGSLAAVLDPHVKSRDRPGLLVVEDIDWALGENPYPGISRTRSLRLFAACSVLRMYQLERGIALMAGLRNDDNEDFAQVCSAIQQASHIQVKLAAGSDNVLVGKEIVTLDDLRRKVEEA